MRGGILAPAAIHPVAIMLRSPFPGHRRYSITHRAVQRLRELVPTVAEEDDEALRDRLDAALISAEDGGKAVRTLDVMLAEPQILIPLESFGDTLYAIIKEDTVVTVLPRGHGEEILQRGQALEQRVAAGGQAREGPTAPIRLTVGHAQRGRCRHPDEGIARPHPRLGGFEQEGTGPHPAELVVQPHRGDVVCQQPGVDADHPAGGGGLDEIGLGGPDRHVTHDRTSSSGSSSKQVCAPVWHAGPTWSTRSRTVSPSQSRRTSRTVWVLSLIHI